MNRQFRTLIVLLFFILFGCSSKPALLSKPIAVTDKELFKYWITEQESVDIAPLNKAIDFIEKGVGGYVIAEYLIDSSGNVLNFKILESEPNGVYDATAERAVKAYDYKPSDSNVNKRPVIVTHKITFEIK